MVFKKGHKLNIGRPVSEETKEKIRAAQKGVARTHGFSKHRLYHIWHSIVARCENKSCPAYKFYGERGITMCAEWHDVETFIRDMYPSYIEGYQLDRIDNEKGYELSNCRWVTSKTNNRNRRGVTRIEYNGETKSITEWAEEYGIKVATLWARVNISGWSMEDALNVKAGPSNNYKFSNP